MVYPTATARRKEPFMQFANPNGVQGNVVSPGVNELIIPNYKQTWAGGVKTVCRLVASGGAAQRLKAAIAERIHRARRRWPCRWL